MRDRSDGAWYFEITKLKDLEERVFPFFDEFPLRGPKAGDLRIFRQIALLVRSREHLDPAGIARILELRSGMNRGGRRRRTDDEIRAALGIGNPQRPYAGLPVEAQG